MLLLTILWRDNTFCKYVSTVAIFLAMTAFHRWDRTLNARVPVVADHAHVIYEKYIGEVDRADRTNALANIGAERCVVGTVGHINVKVPFK